jgi:ABC-type nitrate/sulfonate/bicarbonate transport system permease component
VREIILGIAAAVVVAIAAGIWLGTVQTSSTERYAVSTSVRL